MILKSFEEYPKSTTLWGFTNDRKERKKWGFGPLFAPKTFRAFFSDEILAAPPPCLCKKLQKTVTYFTGIYSRKHYKMYVRS